jgi:hypothetical protein
MNSSENITKLIAAMIALQSEVEDAPKTSKAHNYNYADLGSILKMVRPLLAKHGLCVLQTSSGDQDFITVSTRLCHTSGEFIEDSLTMRVQESRGMSHAQSAGSVITYARRYALATVLGITQVDDDAKVHAPHAGTQYNKPSTDDIF